jgi:DNA-directed RNA polymerase subunit M/transcription elongation factor TFIIS
MSTLVVQVNPATRKEIRRKLELLLGSKAESVSQEKAIYEFAYQDDPERPDGHIRYEHKTLCVLERLRNRQPQDPPRDPASDQNRTSVQSLIQAALVEEPLVVNDAPESQVFLKCRKCKSTQVTFETKQTRSGDEAMTAFLCCSSCGSRWRL